MRFLLFPTSHFISKIPFEWSLVKLMNRKIGNCNAHCELNSQK